MWKEARIKKHEARIQEATYINIISKPKWKKNLQKKVNKMFSDL